MPDSAGTATAYFGGVKTKTAVIGLDDSTLTGDCKSSLNAHVESVMISAQKAGKLQQWQILGFKLYLPMDG